MPYLVYEREVVKTASVGSKKTGKLMFSQCGTGQFSVLAEYTFCKIVYSFKALKYPFVGVLVLDLYEVWYQTFIISLESLPCLEI